MVLLVALDKLHLLLFALLMPPAIHRHAMLTHAYLQDKVYEQAALVQRHTEALEN